MNKLQKMFCGCNMKIIVILNVKSTGKNTIFKYNLMTEKLNEEH
jgi:hypothetical protein